MIGGEYGLKRRIVCLLLLALLVSSCRVAEPDPYAFSRESFFATLSGQYNGISYACDASFSGGKLLRVSFSEPASLASVELLLREDGSYRISRGEISHTVASEDSVRGLLLVRELLCPASYTLLAVERIGGMTSAVLSLSGFDTPVTLLVRDGLPEQISGENFSFLVTVSRVPAPEPRES